MSRVDQSGVLILSEMAGAMHEMAEALLINPNNFQQINDSLIEAIDMPLSEQKRRNKAMQERLQNQDIKQWAQKFMQDLQEKKKKSRPNHGIIKSKILSFIDIKKHPSDKFSSALTMCLPAISRIRHEEINSIRSLKPFVLWRWTPKMISS